MGDFAGLMVPKQVHAAGLSHEERALVWTLLIESGHIPLRTRLGTCNRDLYRPLRWRYLVWTQRIIFQDLYNVWKLIQANRGWWDREDQSLLWPMRVLTLDANTQHPLQVHTRDASTQHLPSDHTHDASAQCPELFAKQLTTVCTTRLRITGRSPATEFTVACRRTASSYPHSQCALDWSLQDEPQPPPPTTTNAVAGPVESESTDATGKQVMPMVTACTSSTGWLSGLGGTYKACAPTQPPPTTNTSSAGTSSLGEPTLARFTQPRIRRQRKVYTSPFPSVFLTILFLFVCAVTDRTLSALTPCLTLLCEVFRLSIWCQVRQTRAWCWKACCQLSIGLPLWTRFLLVLSWYPALNPLPMVLLESLTLLLRHCAPPSRMCYQMSHFLWAITLALWTLLLVAALCQYGRLFCSAHGGWRGCECNSCPRSDVPGVH